MDFDSMAFYYDDMYVDEKSYKAETDTVVRLFNEYATCKGNRLLDLACGTGAQAKYLVSRFEVTGLDLSDEMLGIARSKVKNADFTAGDMCDYHFHVPFDIIINLYGSIGFVKDFEGLRKSINCAYENLAEGGLFILTPWGTKETLREGILAESENREGISLCRMESVKCVSEDKVEVRMFHLVGRDTEIRQFHHTQEISLFTEDEYRNALENAGFKIVKRLDENELRMGAFVCIK